MFKLVRYFSITSFIAFVCVAFLLSLFYRQILLNDLLEIAESKNIALTQAFSNSIWPQFSTFVADASSRDLDELINAPEIDGIRHAVLAEMAGLSVVKVKIYDLEGLTVFSTDALQIGEDKLSNAGYLAARSGEIASELTYRDTFSAFEGTIEDRNVFSSYIPIRRRASGPVEGVFEVYDDVTPLIQQIERSQRLVFFGVSGILTVLYIILYLIVRQADRTIREQHTQLEQTAVALQAANAAKTNFLSNMSHELRTPLNGILGYAQILRRSPSLSEKDLRGVQVIQQSGDYLLTLIDDLLDIAKIEADRFELVPNNLQLSRFLQKLVDLVQVRAHEKGLVFVYEADAHLPETILVDGKRLQQVLLNLLGNAINYTETGEVAFIVSCHPLPTSADEVRLEFAVQDTGIGIAPQDIGRIFNRFERAEVSMVRKVGTGLGLSISQQLVQAMGSTIRVESEQGQGSRFWFDLVVPVFAGEKDASRRRTTQIIGYEGERHSVLVADDEASNRKLLVDLLDSLGFETAVAYDGMKALTVARVVRPALMLVDLAMPKLDGMTAVQQLRQDPDFAQVPVAFVSANVGVDISPILEKMPKAIFLPKPLDIDRLLQFMVDELSLQWQYASASPEEENPLEEIVPPAPDLLARVYDLAMAGDLSAVEAEAERLAQYDRQLEPFANQIKRLTGSFEDEALIAFLKAYQAV